MVTAGASLGIPSLTANRAATLLWLVLGALLTAGQAPIQPVFDHARYASQNVDVTAVCDPK